ncbi:MAG: Fur family transcriptional regulator, ferric uptake regulator [Tepidanaerobacteraceae bacterium]|jgi:Fur family ferric uptake transcriptional regulator|uniref:Fur family transcriptional regulator, ferric uptake regulator n=1 Tax=Caldanaerovirga acetigignens TaxID=447595 RepID=A0A1M7LPH9_9FIRM|nr:transcriptional repressor [Caldanaerovirga acetigignens]MDN5332720.1 Fur family transcriptional regulator, ferric uptake regulator [Tepidanaerobacteraceae bacterium]SHM79567.1 Fur family transcriptional regulator, ferric uptake regulator [Caldanaerovirga acetigignens]
MKQVAVKNIEEKGLRWTPQRQAIISAIANSEKKHLSAEEIYLLTKKTMPSIGLATVYRTLELFCAMGILQKLNLQDAARYELLQKEENAHCHYLCLGCGKIFEVPLQEELPLPSTKNDESLEDFTVVNSSCWHFGYCRNCKLRKENKT